MTTLALGFDARAEPLDAQALVGGSGAVHVCITLPAAPWDSPRRLHRFHRLGVTLFREAVGVRGGINAPPRGEMGQRPYRFSRGIRLALHDPPGVAPWTK